MDIFYHPDWAWESIQGPSPEEKGEKVERKPRRIPAVWTSPSPRDAHLHLQEHEGESLWQSKTEKGLQSVNYLQYVKADKLLHLSLKVTETRNNPAQKGKGDFKVPSPKIGANEMQTQNQVLGKHTTCASWMSINCMQRFQISHLAIECSNENL